MKRKLKITLTSILIIGIILAIGVRNANIGKKPQDVSSQNRIGTMKRDQNSNKPITPEEEGEKLLTTLDINLEDIKKVGVENCIAAYGEDNADKCQCAIDKTDYNDLLAVMMKQIMANPLETQPADDIKVLDAKNTENYESCGLDIRVTTESTKKMVNEAIDKMGFEKNAKIVRP